MVFVTVPKLNLGKQENGYHGLVRENETLVEVTPPIRATGAQICSFKIINKHHTDAPFEVSSVYSLRICKKKFTHLLHR